jgi:signal transduction histidine kinase/ligand-binding sensor domain-containing protein
MKMKDAGIPLLTARLLACVFSAFLCTPAFSLDRDRSITQFFHTAWSEDDGAPSQISALAQTEDGYLWIGSTRGLFRFDGVKFEEYKPQSGVELPSHSIYSLKATPDGGLWIAFRPSGTGFLKDGSLTVFTRPEEMPDSPIHSFARDHDGRIWAGTETGLVLRQGTRWIPIGREWNFGPDMIRDLFVDREGTLWVATVKIIAFLRQGSKAFDLAGAVGRGVTSFSQAKDGRVWYADVDKGGEVRPVPMAAPNSGAESPAIVEDGLHELLFDRDGALWITRLDSGIVRIRYPEKLGNRKLGPQDPAWESFNEKAGFSGGFAYKLLEDREGNIWIGSSKGLLRFRDNHIVPVSLPQRFENLLLLAGEDGELWVGNTGGKPLLHIRGQNLLLEKAGERAASVFRGSNGDVWWGCHDGIWRQNGTNFKYFPLPKGVVPDWMYEIFPSRGDGGLWVKIGDIGVVQFHQGVWNLSDRPNGVPIVGPSAGYLDPSGRVWLGLTAGRVYVLDGEQVTAYSRNDGLDVGRIKVIRGLGQHIWVGGELGLMFFSEGRFRKVNVAAGGPFGAVSGIIETADGELWLNEMRGIVKIPPEEIRQFLADPNHLVKYRRFDYLDGLPGAPQMAFTNSTAVQASDGRLWFATDNGLAWIDPAHLDRNVVPPPVSILSIGNEKGRQMISNAVRFAAGTHTVEIDYTALSLSIPERVEFRYKLEGLDADWQNVGPRRQAYYSNLAPRGYRFRVIACNNDGLWNEEGAILDFSIAPAYYQTAWFRVACVAAFLAFLWALYQYRLQQLARQFSLRLEERVGERTRIARELHDTLLQSFQGLMFRIQAARNMLPRRPEEAMRALDGVLTRSEQAIAESRDAIQDLHSEPAAQSDLAHLLTAVGQELAASQDAQPNSPNFGVTVEGERQTLSPILQDEVYRIAREVLRNAFRHACARHIEAEIRYDDRLLRLRIRDDGKGLDPEALKEGGRAGHWGLPGIRDRAKRIGARLDFWSEAGAGTEVQLTVPASVAYAASSARRRSWFFGEGRKSKVESQKSKVES